MQESTITIINKLGLHARAAAKLVTLSNRFKADIRIQYNNNSANAKSIMSIMMLAAAIGSDLTINIDGEDELIALNAIEELINNRFDEEE